jgi:DEAD/DEAH box helicase domain-containing protein
MALESIQKRRVDEFVATLRLGDSFSERSLPDFRQDWQRFWLLSNILQFLPRFSFVSTEYICLPVDEVQAPSRTPSIIENEWDLAFKFAAPEISGFLLDCQAAHVPAPVVGYELLDEQGRVSASAEVAWEDKKMAVLVLDIEENKPIFERSGWMTFSPADPSGVFLQIYQTR